jgi:mRNA interferase MazF
MPFEFGDVVLELFPFTNQAALKQRPAVVVSSRAYNISKPDVILMAITSQIRPIPTIGEVGIREWQIANLLKPSVIKPVFATLEQGLIVRQLGALQPHDLSSLRTAIATILG